MLSQLITNYPEHLNDVSYVMPIFARHTELEVLECLEDILNTENEHLAFNGLTFLRDGILLFQNSGLLTAYLEGAYIDRLSKFLYSVNHFIRIQVCYTIGKLSISEHVGYLVQAVDHFVNKDPILINRLLFEISWLDKTKSQHCLDKVLDSMYATIRLAGVDTARLAEDDRYYSRAKEIEKDFPVHFIDLEMSFNNFLLGKRLKDYAIEDIESHFQKLIRSA